MGETRTRLGSVDANYYHSVDANYYAYKVLAIAFRLKQYDGTAEEKFNVYISKSLNKTVEEQERKIFKKRRSLIEENTDPSRLKFRKLELFLDGAVVDLSES